MDDFDQKFDKFKYSDINPDLYLPKNSPVTIENNGCIYCILFIILISIIVIALNFLIKFFATLGIKILFYIDFITLSFNWIRIYNPTISWFVLGLLMGSLLGLAFGFLKVGKKNKSIQVFVLTLIVFSCLSIDAYFQWKLELDTNVFQNVRNFNISSQLPTELSKNISLTDKGLCLTDNSFFKIPDQIFENSDVAVSVTKFSGPSNSWIGITLIKDGIDNESYYLAFTDNGYFAMDHFLLDSNNNTFKRFNEIQKRSRAVKPGNFPNQLRITIKDKKIIGWINNKRIRIFEEDNKISGSIAFISLNNSEVSNERPNQLNACFDLFEVKELHVGKAL